MLFALAHGLGFHILSSSKPERKAWRLAVEILLYVLAVAVVFSPILDQVTIIYAGLLCAAHLVLAVTLYIVMRLVKSDKGRAIAFYTEEVLMFIIMSALAFLYTVRWEYFEPWREVRFFLDAYGLEWQQVTAFFFIVVYITRPSNRFVRILLPALDTEEEGRPRIPGWIVGAVERLFYCILAFQGSWIAFAILFLAKCALFCPLIRKDGAYGMRLYVGSMLSALCTIPVVILARPYIL